MTTLNAVPPTGPNANDPQSSAADIAAQARQLADNLTRWDATSPEVIALLRAEADRLDPPAPTGKTVTWEGSTYHLDAEGVTSSGVTYWTRGFIDAVVLPLLADAPDGPIPDETCERAREALRQACGADLWIGTIGAVFALTDQDLRAALEAVRGLPGMAVVRAGAEDTEDARRWRALCKAVRSRPGQAIPWSVFTWQESPPTPDDLARALDDVRQPNVVAAIRQERLAQFEALAREAENLPKRSEAAWWEACARIAKDLADLAGQEGATND